jgi:hypothetical protein
LARRWRDIGGKVLHYGKRVAPVCISVGLVAWLVWRVTPQKLLAALRATDWPWLIGATLVQLVVLFLWDTLNLWWLYSQPDRRLPFWTVLRARTDSVIWSAVNLEIGQGVFAWRLSKDLDMPVTESLSRCVVLALFDFGTLQSLALVASFIQPTPLIRFFRLICAGFVGGMVILFLILRYMPERWRSWLEGKPWGSWLKWWTWRHGVLTWAQRLTMFLLVILYAWVGLKICKIPVDAATVFGVIPFVIVAESLPGTGGLGERDTALVYLLDVGGERAAVVLSFGLIWSTVIILGRVAIGLVSNLLPRHQREARRAFREMQAVERFETTSSPSRR